MTAGGPRRGTQAVAGSSSHPLVLLWTLPPIVTAGAV